MTGELPFFVVEQPHVVDMIEKHRAFRSDLPLRTYSEWAVRKKYNHNQSLAVRPTKISKEFLLAYINF